MTDNTETVEVEGTDPDGESAVIQAFREREKALKADLKAAKADNTDALATARAQVKRENVASQLMSNAGFKGLADIFASEVDGDLTEENATEWLKTRGLEAASDDSESETPIDEQVADVADLGAQVASANRDISEQGFTKQIDELEANAGGSLDTFLTSLEGLS